MNNSELMERFKATIDQFYAQTPKAYARETQLHFIGGVLQAALHILPNENYFDLKKYVYDQHGYDPGGVRTGQFSLMDYEER